MISNADYLIQRYTEAREKVNNAQGDRTYRTYWQGVMNTYYKLLSEAFDGWCEPNSVGYYVFKEQMSYDEALNQTVGILK